MKLLMKMVLLLSLLSGTAFGVTTPVVPVTLDSTSLVANKPAHVVNMQKGTDGFLRMFEAVQTPSNVFRLIRCLNSDCSSNNITTLSGNFGGQLSLPATSYAMALAPDNTPRIALSAAGASAFGNIGFIACSDVDCASSTWTALGYSGTAVFGIAVDSGGTAYFSYSKDILHSGKIGIRISSCVGASCSADVFTVSADETDSNLNLTGGPVRVTSTGTVVTSYSHARPAFTTNSVHMWVGGTDTVISSDGNYYGLSGVQLDATDHVGIAFANFAATAYNYTHCLDVACTTNTGIVSIAIDQTGVGTQGPGSADVAFGTDGKPRLAFSYVGPTQLNPGGVTVSKCASVSCSSATTNFLSANPAVTYQFVNLQMVTVSGTPTEMIMAAIGVGCNPSCGSPTSLNLGLIRVAEAAPPVQHPKFVSRKIIDLISDNPSVIIPVREKEGHPTFTYKLIESPVAFVTSINQWKINTQMVGIPSPSLAFYAPTYPTTPSTPQLPAFTVPINDTTSTTEVAETPGTPVANAGWFFIDDTFTSHFFNVSGTVGATTITDGTGYTLTASGSASILCQTSPCPTVVDVGGNVIAANNVSDPKFSGNVSAFTDPNNVILSAYAAGDPAQTLVYNDSMGYAVLTAASTGATSVPPNGPLPTNQYSYPTANGIQRFIVKYAQFFQSTNFGCDGITEMPRTPVFLPVSVSLPDGTVYVINYEATPGGNGDVTGRIASVSDPAGATTRYQYAGSNNGINCTDGSVPVLLVTAPDGGTWTYTHSLN